jgi:hypothetical protein
VQFSVLRNPASPIFTPSNAYFFTITETEPLGTFVGNVTATDADNVRGIVSFSVNSNSLVELIGNTTNQGKLYASDFANLHTDMIYVYRTQ